MARLSFSPKEYAAYFNALGPRFKKAAIRGLKSGAARCVATLQGESDRAFDSGNFKRGWKWSDIPDGVRIYNIAPYASIVEEGRRPNSRFPPRGVVERWAKRRLGLTDAQAKAAAFPIAAHIAEHGIKGKFILRDVKPKLDKIMKDEMRHEVEVELKR